MVHLLGNMNANVSIQVVWKDGGPIIRVVFQAKADLKERFHCILLYQQRKIHKKALLHAEGDHLQ